jgi:FtsZ-binding cell division protein ZapB
LIDKHENLEMDYVCATNVSTCAALLEKETTDLKAQLEVLTSKHVKVQKDHEKLKCSHENLQDAHAMLQVSHEVVVTSVKHFQSPTQNAHAHSTPLISFVLMFVALKDNNQVLRKLL